MPMDDSISFSALNVRLAAVVTLFGIAFGIVKVSRTAEPMNGCSAAGRTRCLSRRQLWPPARRRLIDRPIQLTWIGDDGRTRGVVVSISGPARPGLRSTRADGVGEA